MPHGHVHLQLVYLSPGLTVSGFAEGASEVELPADLEFKAPTEDFVASFQLVLEPEEDHDDHDDDHKKKKRKFKRSDHIVLSEVFNITSPEEPIVISNPAWLASAVSRMALDGFQSLFTSHFGADFLETTGCHGADELFAEYDLNEDGSLDEEEMVPAAATLTNMLLMGCHLRTAVAVVAGTPLCTPLVPSTEGERWGYMFLSLIIISLPGLFGLVLLRLSKDLLEKVVFNVGTAVAMGGLFGAFIFEFIPT